MKTWKRGEIPPIKDSNLYKYYSNYLTQDEMRLYDEYFSQELPAALRLNCHCKPTSYEVSLSQLLQNYINKRKSGVLRSLPGSTCAFTFDVSRERLRSDPGLNVVNKFLILLNESGLLTRQEYVSMLPPLFLSCQVGEKVLDMCAAPGSKTSQLLEQVGPCGLVCANDVELQRCHVLMHAVIQQPTPQLILTNLDASKYPDIAKFDRVLADVPCSGDGTLRKAKDIVAKWNLHHPASLHIIQLNILLRGLQVLKVNGTLSYSTCSLNVLENEAVINAALAICGNAIEVIDCSQMYPDIIRSPGMMTWKVYDGDLQTAYSSFNDFQEKQAGNPKSKIKIYQTMFPEYSGDVVYTAKQMNEPEDQETTSVTKNNANDCSSEKACKDRLAQLKHAMRFYPWQNNSGGFFVCLIRKKAELPKHPHLHFLQKNALRIDKINDTHEKFNASLSRNIPLHPLRRLENQEIRIAIESRYKLDKFFEPNDSERVLHNLAQRQLLDKNATNVYIFNDKVAEIMYRNDYMHELIHVVQAGCTCFSRYSGSLGHEIGEKLKNAPNGEKSSVGAFRIESSMIYLLNDTDLTIYLTIECFKYLVRKSIGESDQNESGGESKVLESVTIEDLSAQGFQDDAQRILSKKKSGVVLLKMQKSGQKDKELQETFVDGLQVPAFIGGNSISLHLKKKLRHAFRCLLDDQDITEVIVSGQTMRKAEYRERKKQKVRDEQKQATKKSNQ